MASSTTYIWINSWVENVSWASKSTGSTTHVVPAVGGYTDVSSNQRIQTDLSLFHKKTAPHFFLSQNMESTTTLLFKSRNRYLNFFFLNHDFSNNLHYISFSYMCMCLVAQWWPILYNPVPCSLPGFSLHGDSPGKNTAVGCYALLHYMFILILYFNNWKISF